MITKKERRLKIKARTRKRLHGTAERPRLTVFRSNKQIYAQVIDDVEGRTLVAFDSTKLEDKLPTKELAQKRRRNRRQEVLLRLALKVWYLTAMAISTTAV